MILCGITANHTLTKLKASTWRVTTQSKIYSDHTKETVIRLYQEWTGTSYKDLHTLHILDLLRLSNSTVSAQVHC